MTEKEFLKQLTEILETEKEISMGTVLGDLEELDSLSYVSIITMANATCGKRLTVKDIKAANTVADLYKLIQA